MEYSYMFLLSLLFLSFIFLHSIKTKPPRSTLTFFVFAFLYISRRVLSRSPLLMATASEWGLKVFFTGTVLSFDSGRWGTLNILSTYILIVFLWLFLFYISWFMAQKIMLRFQIIKRHLFPTAVFSSLILTSIVYVLHGLYFEYAGLEQNMLSYRPYGHSSFDRLFFSDTSARAVAQCFYFSLYFFTSLFLMEFSKFRTKKWRWIFLVIIFIHPVIIWLFGQQALLTEYILTVSIVLILSFVSKIKMPLFPKNPSMDRYLAAGIIISIAGMIFATFHSVYASPRSLPPLIALLLLSFKKIPRVLSIVSIILVSAAVYSFRIQEVLPAIVPVLLFLLLLVPDYYMQKT